MKFTHLTALVAATMVSFLMMGCGGEPSVDGTDQDVQITKQTEIDLRVVATSGGAKTTVVVHRNSLRPANFVRDPAIDSPYDSDLIVRNRYDYPFITSGNHGIPTDPDTGARSSDDRTSVIRQEQISDLELALETVERLRDQPEVGVKYSWELRSLFYLISHALASAKDNESSKVVPEATPRPEDFPRELLVPGTTPISWSQDTSWDTSLSKNGEVAVAQQAITAPFTHKVSIYWGTCCGLVGYHSAVLLEVRDSAGALTNLVSTRNHGREATDPSLTLSSGCPKTYGPRDNRLPPLQPFKDTDNAVDGDAGGCNTSYGYFNYMHVCNDDSIAEFWNVKYNAAAVYGTCADTTLNITAPSCNN